MPYNPGIGYHGDVYLQRNKEFDNNLFFGWLGDEIARSRRKQELQTIVGSLADYGAPPAQGNADFAGAPPDEAGPPSDGAAQATAQNAEQRGQKADAIRKLMGTYDPNSKTAIKAMSLEQLEGTLKAYTMSQVEQERQARLKQMAEQDAARNQAAAEDQAVGKAIATYADVPDVPTGEGDMMRPATVDERFRAAMRTPGLGGRGVPQLVESLARYNDATDPRALKQPFFAPDKRTLDLPGEIGKRYTQVVTGPNTSALVPIYGDNLQTLPITGPDGQVLGYGLPGGKSGGVTQVKDPGAMTAAERTSLLNVKKSYLAERAKAFMPEDKAHWDTAIQEVDGILNAQGKGGAKPEKPTGKLLDVATAQRFLREAKGDQKKAQAAAEAAGYTWD